MAGVTADEKCQNCELFSTDSNRPASRRSNLGDLKQLQPNKQALDQELGDEATTHQSKHPTYKTLIKISLNGKGIADTSSYHETNLWAPFKAIDGNTDGDIRHDSCFHSTADNKEKILWWKVELLQTYVIHKVIIYNRVDCQGCRGNKL